jgi:hypothetical protein
MNKLNEIENEWIPIEQLPSESMKVSWICEDGMEDYGFYNSEFEQFVTYDPLSEKPITHWKPFSNQK